MDHITADLRRRHLLSHLTHRRVLKDNLHALGHRAPVLAAAKRRGLVVEEVDGGGRTYVAITDAGRLALSPKGDEKSS